MSNDTTCNGYTNWETWHTDLLIDNTESASEQAAALGKRCADIRAGLVKNKSYDPKRAADAFRHAFSRYGTQTRRYARENWPNEPVGEINWLEIAESHMDAADDERAYLERKAAEQNK